MSSEAAHLLHERLGMMVGTELPTREQVRAAIRAAEAMGVEGVTREALVEVAQTIRLRVEPPPLRGT